MDGAYFKGKVLSEFTDIGFSNVDEVIERLASGLPTDILRAACPVPHHQL